MQMMKPAGNVILTLAAALLSAFLGACKESSSNAPVSLQAPEFRQQWSDNKAVSVLVDVRTPGEVDEGIIEGAVAMDFNSPDFRGEIATLPKEKRIYLYCHSGGRSGAAAKMLLKEGFSQVFNLSGGIVAWKENGFPISKP